MEGHPHGGAPRPKPRRAKKTLAGAASGAAAGSSIAMCLQPFDVVRTRMQLGVLKPGVAEALSWVTEEPEEDGNEHRKGDEEKGQPFHSGAWLEHFLNPCCGSVIRVDGRRPIWSVTRRGVSEAMQYLKELSGSGLIYLL